MINHTQIFTNFHEIFIIEKKEVNMNHNPTLNKFDIITDDLCLQVKEFQLKAMQFGSIVVHSNEYYDEKFLHYFRINYILKGCAYIYDINGNIQTLRQGDVALLPPEKELTVDDMQETTLQFINFSILNIEQRQVFNSFIKEMMPTLSVHDTENQIFLMMTQIFQEGINQNRGYSLCIQAIFIRLFMQMVRLANKYYKPLPPINQKLSTHDLFNKAITYINDHITDNITIEAIANHCSISTVYLYKIFKQNTHQSPQQLIMDYRLSLAKNYLDNPSLSIKTIALELGFSSPNHFSNLFKAKEGLSPTQYRKMRFSQTNLND